MTKAVYSTIPPASGFKSLEAARFFAQMEEMSGRLHDAIADIKPEELEWQPALGMNTIGMLLAHLAACEVGWAMRAFEGAPIDDIDAFIAKVEAAGQPDDGMGAPDGLPPEYLRGKDWPYFRDRLSRACEYWRAAASKLTDADLDREIVQLPRGGIQRTYSVRWAMYHVLVHFPHHFGQIQMLRHMYRDRKPE